MRPFLIAYLLVRLLSGYGISLVSLVSIPVVLSLLRLCAGLGTLWRVMGWLFLLFFGACRVRWTKKIFEGEQTDGLLLADWVIAMDQLIKQSFGGLVTATTNVRIPRQVSWLGCPSEERSTLNVDGSAKTNPGKAGFGVLLRNHVGGFRFGFYGSVDHTTVLHTEIMGLMFGHTITILLMRWRLSGTSFPRIGIVQLSTLFRR